MIKKIKIIIAILITVINSHDDDDDVECKGYQYLYSNIWYR